MHFFTFLFFFEDFCIEPLNTLFISYSLCLFHLELKITRNGTLIDIEESKSRTRMELTLYLYSLLVQNLIPPNEFCSSHVRTRADINVH